LRKKLPPFTPVYPRLPHKFYKRNFTEDKKIEGRKEGMKERNAPSAREGVRMGAIVLLVSDYNGC
jgi:hypothetical protein